MRPYSQPLPQPSSHTHISKSHPASSEPSSKSTMERLTAAPGATLDAVAIGSLLNTFMASKRCSRSFVADQIAHHQVVCATAPSSMK